MRGEITKANLGVDTEMEHHGIMSAIEKDGEAIFFQLIRSVLVFVFVFITRIQV